MGYDPSIKNGVLKGPSRSLQTNYTNASGSTLAKGTCVSTNASGQTVLTDVSSEASAQAFLGLVSISTPNAASGGVASGGRLEDIGLSFSIGDAIYVGKDSLMTNIKPDLGSNGFVSDDFVIFLGVVVKNEFDSAKRDIQLFIATVGQL